MNEFLSEVWSFLEKDLRAICAFLGVDLEAICFSLKEILPEGKDTRSTEGYLNVVLCGDRYGTGDPAKERWYKKDKKAIEMLTQILKKQRIPSVLKEHQENDDFSDEQFFQVVLNVLLIIGSGFHLRIVGAMLRCACGRSSNLGSEYFDEKYGKAYTDLEFRKKLWGVENVQPIAAVSRVVDNLLNE